MVQLREDNGLKSCSTNAVGEQRTTLGSIQEAKSEQVFKMKERCQILKYLQLDQKEMQKVEKEEKKKKHMEKLGQRTSKVVTFWESRQKY